MTLQSSHECHLVDRPIMVTWRAVGAGIVELVETPPKLDRRPRMMGTLGMADPGDDGPWGWPTLGMADPNPQTTSISAFCTAIHSFVTGEPRNFKFGTLIYHSKSHPADKKNLP